MSSIKIENEAHWHELRLKNVGASESAALFGEHPFKSAWQLHMEKAQKLPPPDLEAVKHIQQGRHFEPAIAGWASEKWGITLHKSRVYDICDDCPGMGASRDYFQVGSGERIDTDIKWVVQKGDQWEYDGDTITTAPPYIIIQGQHQMACSGNGKFQIIAYIDGDVRRAVYERRPKMIQTVKTFIRRFWFDIAQGNEPLINFKADAEAVMRYAATMPFRQIEWTPEIAKLAESAYTHAKIAKEAEDLAKAARAELTNMMIDRSGSNDPDAKIVTEGGGFRITNYRVAESEGTVNSAECILDMAGARNAFRVCKVSMPKPKAEKKGKKKEAAE